MEEEASLLFEAHSIARIFQIFGNIDRTMILFMIAAQSGITANDIVSAIRMSRPHAYQHLKRLVAGGWIKPVRRGPARAYVCSNLEVHLLLTNLRAIAWARASAFSKEQDRDRTMLLNFRRWQDLKAPVESQGLSAADKQSLP
ncbi:ArsR/SmtB family transcription factor [Solilutibacter silvestris]|uniref:ArsR/SmtB family transcription factor n=1 Tax=Solilutibacter silvestris TaxID=1645665 RepID=UPI00101AD233|nr:winged helix-turn-helix domain-containing protein [Lysobacter silvestris]